jgi:hypothetical protein
MIEWFIESVQRNGKASPTRMTILISFSMLVLDALVYYFFRIHMPDSMFLTFASITTAGLFANKIPGKTDVTPEEPEAK